MDGTWFIQELVKVLQTYAEKRSLTDMLLKLKEQIAERGEFSRDGVLLKIMSDFGLNTMRKALYFKPGMSYEQFLEQNRDQQQAIEFEYRCSNLCIGKTFLRP